MSGGLVGILARGRRSIIPGALTFSILGYLGHTANSAFGAKQLFVENEIPQARALASETDIVRRDDDQPKDNLLQRMARSKWSPMTVVSDQEHRRILLRRKEETDNEIKAINRSIEELKQEGEDQTSKSPDRKS